MELLFKPKEKLYLPIDVIYGLPRVLRGAKRAKIAKTTHNAAILCRVHARRERTVVITWHSLFEPRFKPISGVLHESLQE